MRITQGTFSFLPDFSNEEILAQIRYMIEQSWTPGIEYTDDPHPRNALWEMWGLPMFDIEDAGEVLQAVHACRQTHPSCYIKLIAYDSSAGWQTTRLAFIVQRPVHEPGFKLQREEGPGRSIRYTIQSYAIDRPEGCRYSREQHDERDERHD